MAYINTLQEVPIVGLDEVERERIDQGPHHRARLERGRAWAHDWLALVGLASAIWPPRLMRRELAVPALAAAAGTVERVLEEGLRHLDPERYQRWAPYAHDRAGYEITEGHAASAVGRILGATWARPVGASSPPSEAEGWVDTVQRGVSWATEKLNLGPGFASALLTQAGEGRGYDAAERFLAAGAPVLGVYVYLLLEACAGAAEAWAAEADWIKTAVRGSTTVAVFEAAPGSLVLGPDGLPARA